MKTSKRDGSRRRLAVRKESVRQLDDKALDQVGGGWDYADYLRRCMGTWYYNTYACG